MLSHLELILRLTTGALLGGIIGIERGRHGRPVGLRTHLLVALASATFMIVSIQFPYYQHFGKEDGIEIDASRIAASVVSAIGFLAGGSILRTGFTVQGLTTAAGLWVVTAVGLCAGAGMYVEGTFATALGLGALTILRRFEDKNDDVVRRQIVLVLSDESESLVQTVLKGITDLGAVILDIEYERRLDDKKGIKLKVDTSMPLKVTVVEVIQALEQQPGVKRIGIHHAT